MYRTLADRQRHDWSCRYGYAVSSPSPPAALDIPFQDWADLWLRESPDGTLLLVDLRAGGPLLTGAGHRCGYLDCPTTFHTAQEAHGHRCGAHGLTTLLGGARTGLFPLFLPLGVSWGFLAAHLDPPAIAYPTSFFCPRPLDGTCPPPRCRIGPLSDRLPRIARSHGARTGSFSLLRSGLNRDLPAVAVPLSTGISCWVA